MTHRGRRTIMAIIARDNRKEWTAAPEGLHQAVCIDVVDLGLVPTPWGDKSKVRIVWQLSEINPDTGKPFEVRRDFGLSLSEKAHLRGTLEAWRGRKFTKEELDGFDLERLIGANCQVQIIHNLSDEGRTYANVQAVVPPARNLPKLHPQDYVRVKDRAKVQGNGKEEANGSDEVPF
jgi:hypothetical protein